MSELRFLLDEHVTPVLRAQLIQREPKMVVWVIGDPGAPDHLMKGGWRMMNGEW